MPRLLALLALFALPAFVNAAETVPSVDKLNRPIDLRQVRDLAGRPVEGDFKAVALVFLSFDCPVSNAYAETLNGLYKEGEASGVRLVGVVPGPVDNLAKSVAEFRLAFPVVHDADFKLSDACKVTVTPEAALLDHNRVMRYRGRIDNTWAARLRRNAATTRHELREAAVDLLAGRPVAVPATKSIGCPLRRDAATPISTDVTYYKHVAPILQANCQGCHRPGEVGPFSLTSYMQAVAWASDIKDYTADGRMPPWKPTAGPAFHNARKLSQKDKDTLARWADGGAPEGNPSDAPPPATFTQGWQLGEPDLVLSASEPFHVGASGKDAFRCFVIPSGLLEDKYVVAIDVRPGNPGVVHHTLNYFDTSGQGRKLEAAARAAAKPGDQDRGPGYSVAMGVGFRPGPGGPDGKPTFGGMGGWAPGQMPHPLPEGYGYFLPKGADVIVQVHYHRNGRPETDRTSIGLYFAKRKDMKPYRTLTIPGMFAAIPPGATEFPVRGYGFIDADCVLHSAMPHMHLLGKRTKIIATAPDGTKTTLVAIDNWDYNWQETYWFEKPIPVKAGTKLEILAEFDNSATNPNNPSNPPKTVYPGEETTDEMLFGFVGATTADGGRVRLGRVPPKK